MPRTEEDLAHQAREIPTSSGAAPSPTGGRAIFWPAAAVGGYLVALWLGTHIREDRLPFSLHYEIPLHFCAYGILTVLMFRLIGAWGSGGEAGNRSRRVWRYVVGALLVLSLAMFDEVTQPFTGRSMQGKDLLADLAGICAGIAFMSFCARRNRARRPLG